MKLLKSSGFKVLLSVILLFLVFRLIGFQEIYAVLLSVNLSYILISFVFVLLLILLKAVRWRNIAAAFKANISLADSINYTLISFTFGFVTPGRVGEFIKGKYLADKTKAGYFKSFLTAVIDKAFDIASLFGSALLGIAFLDINLPFSDLFIYLFISYIIILILIFLFFDKSLKFAKFFLPKKYRDDLEPLSITRKIYLSSLGISFLIWIFLSAAAFFILKSMDIPAVSLLIVMIAVPLMALSSQLPISFGGIGVRELVAVYLFSTIGIAAEKSAAFSLIYTFVSFIVPAIIGAFLYLKLKR
ncbi:flippase-like domain-containing protein [Candidatus Woesearchaeota archaeon]|nr:flippase-like domain-containing protein [Candidatus Woesearchaeota archaeon]